MATCNVLCDILEYICTGFYFHLDQPKIHENPLFIPNTSEATRAPFFWVSTIIHERSQLSSLGQQVLHSGLHGASTKEHSGVKRRHATRVKMVQETSTTVISTCVYTYIYIYVCVY